MPKPAGKLRPVEGADVLGPSDFLAEAETAEGADLPEEARASLRAMRAAATGIEAEAGGSGLAEAVRLYAAGAVDFRNGALPEAEARFRAVLDLPPDRRRERATWAAFMLGRAAAAAGDAERAAEAFRLTRALAREGAPDPLGLAVASYGQEAKLPFARAAGLAGESGPLPADAADAYGQAVAAATALYAEQAALGSRRAILSLRIVAEAVLDEPSRLEAAVADPLVQRLLVAYVLALVSDVPPADAVDADGLRYDAGSGSPGVAPAPVLVRLVAAAERRGIAELAGADRLAALAYRGGRYDLAERLAGRARTPLGAWVRAKLALRRGDTAAAAAAYAEASRAFPDAVALDPESGRQARGEAAVLALAGGEYVAAMEALLPLARTYWGDVAYIGERVLTTEELSGVVARLDRPGGARMPREQRAALRDLLARRLMREGRFAEALPLFRDDLTRSRAAAYADALAAAEGAWRPIARARHLFVAAVLARRHGLEMMGTEGPPDQADSGANYPRGAGRASLAGPYLGPDEPARFAATAAQPNLRFHYRFVAADHAARAADLLPRRSQAFAAVLCRAALWMNQTPESGERARLLYRRYLREGARVPFATTFGQDCPDPDFRHAADASRPQAFRRLRAWLGWT